MDNQNLLEIAADVCMQAHIGQRDKAGKAYFLHPMRIAMRCKTDEERIVALLHDTIEDSDITPESSGSRFFAGDRRCSAVCH